MKLLHSAAVLITISVLVTSSSGRLFANEHSNENSQELLYPYSLEDYQQDINDVKSQINKDLDFNLPFYGFHYNFSRVSLNGYLQFTDAPEHYTYPLKFPRNYPLEKDPAFIGPFFSKIRIGLKQVDKTENKNGVYFRVESNLDKRTDKNAAELKERVKADLRGDGIVGAKKFEPKHLIITTWKGVTFQGGIDSSKYITNTFQAVIATDEIKTYAIFNYADINWTTHAEAGGDAAHGEGGVPALVGFNAGKGTRAFEYRPFSQRATIRDLTTTGCVKGRHIFKIDGKVAPSTCSENMDYVCHLYLDQN